MSTATEPQHVTLRHIIPIVISVNMDDFLSITLRENRPLFETYYVVTSPTDTKTQALCLQYNVNTILFHDFKKGGCKFNKSGALFTAQKEVYAHYPDKWILIMDTDIVVPRDMAEVASLDRLSDRNALYGMRRKDAHTYDDYVANKLVPYKHTFAGYFQLYYDKSQFYASRSSSASHCDISFMKCFRTKKLLPSSVIHLGVQGAHWNGRSCDRYVASASTL
jgi:hypothetical protein